VLVIIRLVIILCNVQSDTDSVPDHEWEMFENTYTPSALTVWSNHSDYEIVIPMA
jgi:hypothetical protein